MLKDQQFEAQKIWKGKGMMERLFVLKSGDTADLTNFHCKILKKVLGIDEGYTKQQCIELCSWLDPAKNTFSWE